MDTSKLLPESQIYGEDAVETADLRRMLQEAKDYIASFSWAPDVAEAYYGIGVGGVLGVYLVRFAEPIGDNSDEYLWVVTGDVPSAYFVVDLAPGAVDALEVYCELMTDWAETVKRGSSLEEVFPVNAPPDLRHADMLLSRVKFIRDQILPEFSQ